MSLPSCGLVRPPTSEAHRGRSPIAPDFERRIRYCLERLFQSHSLSWQEESLMVGVAAGLTNRELAAWTGWTEDTVETYFKHLNAKLAIHSRGQAIHQVIEELLDQLDMREGAESAASEGR